MRANISTHGGTHDDVAPLGDDVENLGAIASTAETPTIATHRGSLKLGRLVWINAVNKITEPTLKSKACLKCLYFTKIISALCCYLEYFSYLYTIN